MAPNTTSSCSFSSSSSLSGGRTAPINKRHEQWHNSSSGNSSGRTTIIFIFTDDVRPCLHCVHLVNKWVLLHVRCPVMRENSRRAVEGRWKTIHTVIIIKNGERETECSVDCCVYCELNVQCGSNRWSYVCSVLCVALLLLLLLKVNSTQFNMHMHITRNNLSEQVRQTVCVCLLCVCVDIAFALPGSQRRVLPILTM